MAWEKINKSTGQESESAWDKLVRAREKKASKDDASADALKNQKSEESAWDKLEKAREKQNSEKYIYEQAAARSKQAERDAEKKAIYAEAGEQNSSVAKLYQMIHKNDKTDLSAEEARKEYDVAKNNRAIYEQFPTADDYLEYLEEVKAKKAKLNAWDALVNKSDFEEKSAYKTTKNGKERSYSLTGSVNESGYDDVLYDYINGNKDARAVQGNIDLQSYTTHSELNNLPDTTIKIFNYIYATEGKDAAYEYIDAVTDKEYTPIEAAVFSALNSTGITSAATLLGKGMTALGIGGDEAKENVDEMYSKMNTLQAESSSQHPVAATVGSVTGNVLLLGAISNATAPVGNAIANFIAKKGASTVAASFVSRMATSALNFALSSNVQNAGALATGNMSAGEFFAQGAGGALSGAASAGTSYAVSHAVGSALIKHGMTNAFSAWIKNVSSAAAGSVAYVGTGVAWDEVVLGNDVSDDEVIIRLATAFAFDLITSTIQTFREGGFGERALAELNEDPNAGNEKTNAKNQKPKTEYFKDCNTIEELKTKYRTLAKQNHPDFGGSNEIMAEINLEYQWYLSEEFTNAINHATQARETGNKTASEAARNEYKNAVIALEEMVSQSGGNAETRAALDILNSIVDGMSPAEAAISGKSEAGKIVDTVSTAITEGLKNEAESAEAASPTASVLPSEENQYSKPKYEGRDLALANYGKNVGMSDEAIKSLVRGYNGSADMIEYATAFTDFYIEGKKNTAISEVRSKSGAVLSENQKRMAWNSGRIDELISERIVDNASNLIKNNENRRETIYNAEQERGRNGTLQSGERNARIYSGVKGEPVEGNTEQAEVRRSGNIGSSEKGVDGNGKTNQGETVVSRKISTRSLGLKSGTTRETVEIVPGEEINKNTKAREIVRKNKEAGIDITFVRGKIEAKKGGRTVSANGAISADGKRIFINYEDPNFDIESIESHEKAHLFVRDNPDVLDNFIDELQLVGLGDEVEKMARIYKEALLGADATDEDTLEEIFADAVADMDKFHGRIGSANAKKFHGAAERAMEYTESEKTETENDSNGEKLSIVEASTEGGKILKYVQADRQIVKGKSRDEWKKAVYNYITNDIMKGEPVYIKSAEGDVLEISDKTAWKNQDDVMRNKKGEITRPLTDKEFDVKTNAALHIDELVEVSKIDKRIVDKKARHLADNFSYRTAFFEDYDGQYYALKFSVMESGMSNTVYNIGNIEKRDFPFKNRGSSDKIGAQGEISANSILENENLSIGNFSGIIDKDILERLESVEQRQKKMRAQMASSKNHVDIEAAGSLAKSLMTDYTGDTSVSAMQNKIRKLGKMINEYRATSYDESNSAAYSAKENAWEKIDELANEIASDIVSNAVSDSEPGKEYKKLIDILRPDGRKRYLRISEKAFNADKNLFYEEKYGRLKDVVLLTTGHGMTVDDLYAELNHAFPDLFDDGITAEFDRIAKIAEVTSELKEASVGGYSVDKEEAITELKGKLFGSIEKMPPAEASAYEKAVERMKASANKRYEELKEHNREVRKNQSESREKSELKDSLAKLAKRLDRVKNASEGTKAWIDDIRSKVFLGVSSIPGMPSVETVEQIKNFVDKHPDYEIDERIRIYINSLSKKKTEDLTLDELRKLVEAGRNIEYAQRNENKLLAHEEQKTLWEAADTCARNIRSAANMQGRHPAVRAAYKVGLEAMSPETFFGMVTGWRPNDPLQLGQKKLEDGEMKAVNYRVDAKNPFRRFTSDSEFMDKLVGKHAESIDVEVFDEGGMPFTAKIPRSVAISLTLAKNDKQNLSAIAAGGYQIPDMDEFRKGHLDSAYDEKGKIVRFSLLTRKDESLLADLYKAMIDEIPDTYLDWETNEVLPVTEEKLNDADWLENYFLRYMPEDVYDRKVNDVYKEIYRSKFVAETRRVIEKIEEKLTDKDRALRSEVRKYFNVFSPPKLDETSMVLNGIPLSKKNEYFPKRHILSMVQDADGGDGAQKSRRFENSGFAKNRLPATRTPVKGVDVIRQLNTSISEHANYIGFAVPMRDMRKLLKTSINFGKETLQKVIEREWLKEGSKYIKNYLDRVQGSLKNNDTWFAEAAEWLRNKHISAVLIGNLSVIGRQFTSILGAVPILGVDSVAYGLSHKSGIDHKTGSSIISEYSKIYENRMSGFFDQDLEEIAMRRGKYPMLLKGISGVDLFTVRRELSATVYKVLKDNPNLKNAEDEKSTAEFKKKVAEKYVEVINVSQPTNFVTRKPQFLRSDNAFVRQFNSFMTQPLQYANMLMRATLKYSAYKKMLSQGVEGITKDMVDSARKDLISIYFWVGFAASFFNALLKTLWRGAMGRYMNSDFGEAAVDMALDFLGSGMQMVPAVGPIVHAAFSEAVKKWAGYSTYSGDYIETLAFGTINDLVGAVISAITNKNPDKTVEKYGTVFGKIADIFGLPGSSFVGYIKAIAKWIDKWNK